MSRINSLRSRSEFRKSILAAAVAAAGALPLAAFAQVATWTGGTLGSWSLGTNWSGGASPNSATADVFVDFANVQNTGVTLDISRTILNLTISSGDQVNQDNNVTLSWANGGVLNLASNASFNLNAGANNSAFAYGGSLNITGLGVLNLTTSGAGVALLGGSGTLNNASIIRGTGLIGNNVGVLANTGTVAATSGAGITIDPRNNGGVVAGTSNSGTFLADGGVLTLTGANLGFIDNTGGRIIAISSDVNLVSNIDIRGGTLSSTGGGGAIRVLTGNTGNLTNVTNTGNLVVDNNSQLNLGGSFTNTGIVSLNAGTNNSILSMGGSTNFSGAGTVLMNATGQGGTPILTGSGTMVSDNTIIGSGSIGNNQLTVINGSSIIANGGSLGITIDAPNNSSTAGFVNNGTLLANGGVLSLTGANSGFFNNAAGRIIAGSTDVQLVGNVDIRGGTLSSTGAGVIRVPVSNTGNLTAATSSATIVVENGGALNLGTSLANTGTINLAAGASNAAMNMGGSFALTGGGLINMTTTGAGGGILLGTGTVTSDNNIQGTGNIGNNTLTFTSSGLIKALTGGLTIDPPNNTTNPGFTNNGTLLADTGALTLTGANSGFFNNASGRMIAGASDVQLVGGASVIGGTFSAAGAGVFRVPAATSASLTGVSSSAPIVVDSGATLFLGSSLANTSTMNVNAGSTSSAVSIGGVFALTGGGIINLSTTGAGTAFVLGSGTVTSDNTIQGTGNIGNNNLTFTNSGLIRALAGGLTIDPPNNSAIPGFTSSGTLLADTGALVLTGANSGFFSNTGQIIAGASDVQLVGGVSVGGGTLASSGTGIIRVPFGNNASIINITNTGNITHQGGGGNLFVGGTITNNGSININSGTNTASTLNPNGASVTLNGTGVLNLTEAGGGAVIGGGGTLLNSTLIRGTGNVGNNVTTLVNTGTILANTAAATLTIDPPNNVAGGGFVNTNGTIMSDGGLMSLTGANSGFFDNTNGRIIAASTDVQLVGNASVVGGTLSSSGTGIIRVTPVNNASITNITNTGNITHQGGGGNLFVGGTITNNGSININSGTNTASTLNPNGASVTLNGTGVLNLTEAGGGAVIGGGGTLINSTLIRGSGNVGNNVTTLVNTGTILANTAAATLTIDPPNNSAVGGFVNNNGTIMADGGLMSLTGSNSGFVDNTNGRIIAASTDVQLVGNVSVVGGTLSSSGTGIIRVAAVNNASITNIANTGNITHQGGGGNLFMGGTITNNGSMNLNSGTNTSAILVPSGTVTLTGSGVVNMNEAGGGAIIGGGGTLLSSQLVRGGGNVGNNVTTVVNTGTVLANSAAFALTIDPPNNGGQPGFVNNGLLRASGGHMIVTGSNSGFMSGTGSIDIAADGSFTATTSASLAFGPLTPAGTLNIINSSFVSATHVRGTGSINVNNSGLLRVAVNGTDTGTSKITSLNLATSGRLDLTDNDLVFDYAGASPVTTIVGHLASARNNGPWNGGIGITSSSAAATSGQTVKTAIGWRDNTTGAITTFSGQSVDNTSILLKYTYYGDTDLDGKVDVGDLGTLASNWQTAGPWINGDFDYNGTIDVNDLGLLASNWQAGVGNPLGPSLSDALAGLGLPTTSVPEPTALVAIGLSMLGMGGRRFRRST